MNKELQYYKDKWSQTFRPDLSLPVHIKRKIYRIYRQRLFEDLEQAINVIYEKEVSQNSSYFSKNFASVDDMEIGDGNYAFKHCNKS